MEVNISQLRQHLPDYLARVRQGERISITSRGRVVAEMVPPTATAEAAAVRASLEGSPVRYDDPTGPVPTDDA